MSVFEKHADGLKIYEDSSGLERGRLLFAMAILSDCQEMAGEGAVTEEINEAKELLSSVIKTLEPLNSLWGCRETIRDGESEYGCEFFVYADSLEAAEMKAWEQLKSNYDEGDEATINESGWLEISCDYRWARVDTVRQIRNLEELMQFLCIPLPVQT